MVNKKGKMLEEKKSHGPTEVRSRKSMSISSGKSGTQMEGGELMPEFARSGQSNPKMVSDVTDLCYSAEDNAFITEIEKIN